MGIFNALKFDEEYLKYALFGSIWLSLYQKR